MKLEGYVVVGKIGSPYGVKGWLKIQSYTTWVDNILNYTPWYVADGENWIEVQVLESKEHGKGLIVKLSGYHSPESARLLSGKMIAVHRDQLPELKQGEYYWSDLEGLTVINQDGQTLGKVIYLIETGSNDVLVVKGAKEYAIPYLLQETITKIDLTQQVIHVIWEP